MIDRKSWRLEIKRRFSRTPVWPEPEIEEGWRELACVLVEALDASGASYTIDQLKQKWGSLVCRLDVPVISRAIVRHV